MLHILLLDNYDSFTYNLEHYLVSLGAQVDVIRSDEPVINPMKYNAIVLSPGSGLPSQASGMMNLIKEVDSKIPILGVCLGMQAIAEYLEGELYNQNEVKHGVSEKITVNNSPLFIGLNSEIEVGLYHSWAVSDSCGIFEVAAHSSEGTVMAIQNIEKMMYGVQFHPESIMTPNGKEILQNFLAIVEL